jgi:hypothetical protein
MGQLSNKVQQGLGGFVVFNVTFNNISAISWRKAEYPEKTIDLSQVTDKLIA